MQITVLRKYFTKSSTISELWIDDAIFCYTIEDRDRGLTADMPLSEIKRVKVHGQTAIPTGTYQLIINESARFKRLLPLLVGVPGFAGIRIHAGNFAKDSDGCLLPGTGFTRDMITNSRTAFNNLFPLLQDALKTEKVSVTIQRDPAAWAAFRGLN